jgi:hypothetical protein
MLQVEATGIEEEEQKQEERKKERKKEITSVIEPYTLPSLFLTSYYN